MGKLGYERSRFSLVDRCEHCSVVVELASQSNQESKKGNTLVLPSPEDETVVRSAPRPLDVHAVFASRMAAAGIQPQDRIGTPLPQCESEFTSSVSTRERDSV